MPGKFELIASKNGKIHFCLKASNGQVLLTSEKYESREGAVKGIESVKRNASQDGRFERKKGKDGSSYFVLKASNGEPLGRSEMYKRTSSMEGGIASAAKNAAGAPVVEK